MFCTQALILPRPRHSQLPRLYLHPVSILSVVHVPSSTLLFPWTLFLARIHRNYVFHTRHFSMHGACFRIEFHNLYKILPCHSRIPATCFKSDLSKLYPFNLFKVRNLQALHVSSQTHPYPSGLFLVTIH
jgi:hypothetical protein